MCTSRTILITTFNCAKVSYFYFDLFCVVIAFFETCKHSLYFNDKVLLLPNFFIHILNRPVKVIYSFNVISII